MRRLAAVLGVLLLASLPAYAQFSGPGMTPSASNATLPEAQNRLGIGPTGYADVTMTCTTTNGSANVTGCNTTTGLAAGYFVTGPGVVSGTTVAGSITATGFAMSANAGAAADTGTVTGSTNTYALAIGNYAARQDAAWSKLGSATLRVGSINGNRNGIVGTATNYLAPSTTAYPTGVAGLGQVAVGATGNLAFGANFVSEVYDLGVGKAQENDCRNYKQNADSALPPDTAVGTAGVTSLCLTLNAGGDFPSSVAMIIGTDAAAPQPFYNGIFYRQGAVTATGFKIAAGATAANSPSTTMYLQNSGDSGHRNLIVQTSGTPTTGRPAVEVVGPTDNAKFTVDQNGNLVSAGRITQPFTHASQTDGFSATIADDKATYIVTGAGTLASGTITMKAAPLAGEIVRISCMVTVTTLTVSANSGQAISGAPTTCGVTAPAAFIYNSSAATPTWVRVH